MTTNYHTALVSTDDVDTQTVNQILESLDQQMQDMDDGTHAFSAIDIDGGAIDGATIGANSAGAGTFTDLSVVNNISVGSVFFAGIKYAQFVNTSSSAVVGWNVELLDTDSVFDTSIGVHRFTPSTAGYYFLAARVTWQTPDATTWHYTQLRKNGSEIGTKVMVTGGTFDDSIPVGIMVQANGTTDYFDVLAFNGSANSDLIITDDRQSFFCGFRVF